MLLLFSGENSIVIVKGANDCLTKQHLLQAEELIRDSKVVLFQLEIDLDVTLSGIKLAKENKGINIGQLKTFLSYPYIVSTHGVHTWRPKNIFIAKIRESPEKWRYYLQTFDSE